MQIMQRIQNRKGFTLVELMIVVAIIGILAAIAIPAFLRAVKKSKTSEADGNIKKMVDGAKSYFTSEQKVSKDLSSGGAEPWHTGSAAAVGYPVDWDDQVFPGGGLVGGFSTDALGATPETTIAAAAVGLGDVVNTGACAGANIQKGGTKVLPFGGTPGTPIQPAAGTDVEHVILNKLNISFTDPTYFQYHYHQAGTGADAGAVAAARADFKDGGNCHSYYQGVIVNDTTQEVEVIPGTLENEFE